MCGCRIVVLGLLVGACSWSSDRPPQAPDAVAPGLVSSWPFADRAELDQVVSLCRILAASHTLEGVQAQTCDTAWAIFMEGLPSADIPLPGSTRAGLKRERCAAPFELGKGALLFDREELALEEFADLAPDCPQVAAAALLMVLGAQQGAAREEDACARAADGQQWSSAVEHCERAMGWHCRAEGVPASGFKPEDLSLQRLLRARAAIDPRAAPWSCPMRPDPDDPDRWSLPGLAAYLEGDLEAAQTLLGGAAGACAHGHALEQATQAKAMQRDVEALRAVLDAGFQALAQGPEHAEPLLSQALALDAQVLGEETLESATRRSVLHGMAKAALRPGAPH